MDELVNDIGQLTVSEKTHILSILKSKIHYTKNSNGYFFNIKDIFDNPDVLEKVRESINLIITNRNIIDDINYQRETIVQEYKNKLSDDKNTLNDEQALIDFENSLVLIRPSMYVNFVKDDRLKTRDPDAIIEAYNLSIKKRLKNNKVWECMKRSGYTSNRTSTVAEPPSYADLHYDEDVSIVVVCDDRDQDDELGTRIDVDLYGEDDSCTEYSEHGKELYRDIKDEIEFYKSLLIPLGYAFVEGNHDILVFQDYIVQ